MKEFCFAALPYVLAGLAVVVLCAGKGKATETGDAKSQENRLALGMLLGLAIGVALDSCGVFESPMIGLTLGPLWGMALASLGTKSSLEHTDTDEKKKTGRDHLPCNTKKKLS